MDGALLTEFKKNCSKTSVLAVFQLFSLLDSVCDLGSHSAEAALLKIHQGVLGVLSVMLL